MWRFIVGLSFALTALTAGPVYQVVPVPYAGALMATSFTDNGWVTGRTADGRIFVSNGVTVDYYTPPSDVYGASPLIDASGRALVSVGGNAYYLTAGVWTQVLGIGGWTAAFGIADSGTSVGIAHYPGNVYNTGAMWEPSGAIQASTNSFYSAISRNGQYLLGSDYFFNMYVQGPGGRTTFPNTGQVSPLAVNDQGQFIAQINVNGIFQILAGDSSGFTTLPLAPAGMSASTFPQPFNNQRQLVFSRYPGSGGVLEGAYLWDPVHGVRNLSDLAGAPIRFGYAINNLGQIIAESDGRLVMLDPIAQVPEPGTLVMVGVGLVLVGRVRRRVS